MDPVIPKPYTIKFEERAEYLFVYVAGEHDNYDISKQYWLEIRAECDRTGLIKVLIHEDISENGTMADAYKLMAELPDLGFLGKKISFVDRYL